MFHLSESFKVLLYFDAESTFSCSIVRYVTGETTMKEGADLSVVPEKALIDQEKELLEKYKVSICHCIHS